MSKIPIIIPTHNDGKYLQQCLQSIKNQEFQDFECIIIDDGSTDDTHQIASEFSALDNRFFIIISSSLGNQQLDGGHCRLFTESC